jgi:RNA polymerase sigma-70 factor (ECF subfamily)
MTTRQDIEDMILRVAMQDRSAFEALYSATSAKLFGIILRVLKDRAAAEEVLEEVYLRL